MEEPSQRSQNEQSKSAHHKKDPVIHSTNDQKVQKTFIWNRMWARNQWAVILIPLLALGALAITYFALALSSPWSNSNQWQSWVYDTNANLTSTNNDHLLLQLNKGTAYKVNGYAQWHIDLPTNVTANSITFNASYKTSQGNHVFLVEPSGKRFWNPGGAKQTVTRQDFTVQIPAGVHRIFFGIGSDVATTYTEDQYIVVYSYTINGSTGTSDPLPTVSISSPVNSATVSGNTNITAAAASAAGVAGVTFKADGATVGSEDTTSPYSATWDTAKVSNGSHNLTAVVRDKNGKTVTSQAVSVTVQNGGTTTPPTTPSTPPASSTDPTPLRSFYVDPNGNDSNNGTSQSTPWKTISKVNSADIKAGDAIYFKGGGVWTGTVLMTKRTGTAAAPIKYASYGTGRPQINAPTGEAAFFSASGASSTSRYNIIDGFYINGGSIGINIGSNGQFGMTVRNTEIYDSLDSCIIDWGYNSTYDKINVHHCGRRGGAGTFVHAIYAKGPNMTIKNSEFHDISGGHEHVSLRYEGALVTNNKIYGGGTCLAVFSIEPTHGNVRIENNDLRCTGVGMWISDEGPYASYKTIFINNNTLHGPAKEGISAAVPVYQHTGNVFDGTFSSFKESYH